MATKPTLQDTLDALKIFTGKKEFDAAYDVNGDGKVDLTDVMGLQKAYLGKDPGFAFSGDVFSSPSTKTAADYAAEEQANQQRLAAEQKETERRQSLLADAQKINGQVNADLVANNPNLNAQQLSSLARRNYWSNESEAFSRVMSAMENGTAQLKQVQTGYLDETGNPETELRMVAPDGPPGYNSLTLRATPQAGVYQFSTPNQVAGGMIHGVIQADPKTGQYAPVQDYTKQIQYTPGQSGSVLGGMIGDLGDIYKSLGPIAPILANAVAPGLGSALSAVAALDEGNVKGALLSGLSAAGSYGNAALQAGDTSGLGGVLAENLPEIKTATSAAQLANAVQTGNIGGALNAAGNLTGVAADPTISTAVKTIGLVQALDSGNTAQALVLAGQLTDNPDVKVAGDALKLVNAINSGNAGAVQSAANSLAKATNADDVASTLDQKTIDDVLDSVTKTDQTLTADDLAKIVSGENILTGAQDINVGSEDTLVGGEDTLVGGEDTTVGGEDTLTHQDLINIIRGGEDTAVGGGEDTLTGGEDTTAGGGEDTLTGGEDTLTGGEDTLVGGEDTLTGGEDTTVGGEDTTVGGEETKVDCGPGFYWNEDLQACLPSDIVEPPIVEPPEPPVVEPPELPIVEPPPPPEPSVDCGPGFHWDEELQACIPDVVDNQCAPGFHWDESLQACVPDEVDKACNSGFHWDEETQSCVPDDTRTECAPGFHWDEQTQSCVPDVVDNQCAEGFHWDEERQMCMPDDDVDAECAEGFHWDEDLQICVPNDDKPDDSTKCPDGYVYNVVTQTCELITDNPPINPPINRLPQPPTSPKKPAVNTPSNQLDLADLFLALGMGGIQPSAPQQPQQVPVVGESAGFDFSSPLDVGLFGRSAQKNTQNQPGTTKISTGGYLDDLLDAIK